jgi:hypothetical protein
LYGPRISHSLSLTHTHTHTHTLPLPVPLTLLITHSLAHSLSPGYHTETHETSATAPAWEAPDAPAPAPAPTGWAKTTDPSSGAPYWYRGTEVTWSDPSGAAAAAPAPYYPPAPLVNPWEMKTKVNGDTYWLNRDTKELSDSDPNLH